MPHITARVTAILGADHPRGPALAVDRIQINGHAAPGAANGRVYHALLDCAGWKPGDLIGIEGEIPSVCPTIINGRTLWRTRSLRAPGDPEAIDVGPDAPAERNP